MFSYPTVFQLSLFLILFIFFLFRAAPVAYGRSQVRGSNQSYSCQPTPQPQQQRIWATSATYITVHGNARSLIHWARTGIEPANSWFLVGFISPVPRQELPLFLIIIKHSYTHFMAIWNIKFWANIRVVEFFTFHMLSIIYVSYSNQAVSHDTSWVCEPFSLFPGLILIHHCHAFNLNLNKKNKVLPLRKVYHLTLKGNIAISLTKVLGYHLVL